MIKTFKIGGMHCAACAASVERVTKKLPFTDSAQVNLLTEKLTIRGDGIDDTAVIAAVERIGFTAEPYQAEMRKTAVPRTSSSYRNSNPRQFIESYANQHKKTRFWRNTMYHHTHLKSDNSLPRTT